MSLSFDSQNWFFFLQAAIQVVGLVAAWLARASQGSNVQPVCQRLFLAALVLVSASAIASMHFPSGLWIVSGATLSVMIVGTTCDFSRTHGAGSF